VNQQETAILVRVVRATCPAQKIDEYTPDAWHPILAGISLEDARQAVAALGAELPFIAPADIVKHVRKTRTDRARRLPMPCPNVVFGVSEGDEIRAIERAMADGLITTLAEVYAYEAWGGSLHLAWQRGTFPALEGPEPKNEPIELPGVFGRVPT
jgi:hypothetical protein